MSDAVSRYGGSVYQHGPHNDRIYLMRLSPDDVPGIIHYFDELSQENGYSKIFVKVPASASPRFLSNGYRVEARIPGLYHGREDGLFMARYLDERRGQESEMDSILDIVKESVQRAEGCRSRDLPKGYSLHACSPEDAEEIAALYGRVFISYPFPIDDPEYIRATMQDHFRYFSVRKDGEIVAMSSAEINFQDGNVEMTDFATDHRHSCLNLAGHLLALMEEEMKEQGIRVAFTIARALSIPISITFARAGYLYAGTLLNNTNICGSFESMNVWYKALQQ